MIKVKKILLSKLLNMEIPILIEELIEILKEHDLDELRLKDMYDLLVKQAVVVETFQSPYGKHVLTKEVGRLHKKRLKYAILIHMQVKSLENIDDKEIQHMAKAAMVLTGKTLTYLGRKNIKAVDEAIGRFFYSLEADKYATAREAFVYLGLQPYLDELRDTNEEYTKLYNLRSKDIKDRPKRGDAVVRRDTLNMMRMFFDQVNYNQRIYKEVDYGALIQVVNLILTRNSKYIKTRIATNKRRARKKAAAENVAAVDVAQPVSVVEIEPAIISESKSTSDDVVHGNSNRSMTHKLEGKNNTTISAHMQNGTKRSEISNKDLMKVLKRPSKEKRGDG